MAETNSSGDYILRNGKKVEVYNNNQLLTKHQLGSHAKARQKAEELAQTLNLEIRQK